MLTITGASEAKLNIPKKMVYLNLGTNWGIIAVNPYKDGWHKIRVVIVVQVEVGRVFKAIKRSAFKVKTFFFCILFLPGDIMYPSCVIIGLSL